MENPEKANPQRRKVDYRLLGAGRRRKWEVTANGYGFWGVRVTKMSWNWVVLMVVQSCEYTKTIELYTLKGSVSW